MAEEDIVVEVEGDEPVVAKVEGEEPKQQNDPAVELKSQLDEITAKADRAQKDADAAQSRVFQEQQARFAAERERDATKTEVASSRLETILAGIESAEKEAKAAWAESKAGFDQGDWEKVTQAQSRAVEAVAEKKRLEEAKYHLEAEKTAPPPRQAQEPARDPLERFLSERTPQAQAWLRAHPDEARALVGGNPRRAAKITAADNDAVAEGFERDTPEYFAHIEKYLGMTKEETPKPNGNGTVKVAEHTRKAPSVAPVSASSGGTSGGTEVRLTKGEALSATDGTLQWNFSDPKGKFKKGDPIGVQEFARRKKTMMEQGLYDKTFLEQ